MSLHFNLANVHISDIHWDILIGFVDDLREREGKGKSLSRARLLATPWTATPWTAAYQAPPSMGFSRQEYWSGVT